MPYCKQQSTLALSEPVIVAGAVLCRAYVQAFGAFLPAYHS